MEELFTNLHSPSPKQDSPWGWLRNNGVTSPCISQYFFQSSLFHLDKSLKLKGPCFKREHFPQLKFGILLPHLN